MNITTVKIPTPNDTSSAKLITDQCLLPDGICRRVMPNGAKSEDCPFFVPYGAGGEWCNYFQQLEVSSNNGTL